MSFCCRYYDVGRVNRWGNHFLFFPFNHEQKKLNNFWSIFWSSLVPIRGCFRGLKLPYVSNLIIYNHFFSNKEHLLPDAACCCSLNNIDSLIWQLDRNLHIVVLKENKTTWNWRDNKEQTLETETTHQLYQHVRFLKFAKLFEVPSKTMDGSFWMIVLTFLMNFEFDRSTWLSWLSLSD